MSKTSPLVSIGMPVRNCQDTLPIAIRSILKQTYPHWKLFIIDDGSSDSTLSVAKQFEDSRIQIYCHQQSRGLPVRLNQVIALSEGKYFARMDGDDVAYPERLERQVDYLEQHPQVDLVGTWAIVFGASATSLGKRSGPETHAAICAKPLAGFQMVHPTYLGRLGWFRRYYYDEKLLRSQDQDLLLRSYLASEFANVPEILLGYREERISLRKTLTWRWYLLQAIRREFIRQGRPGAAMRGVLEQALKGIVDFIAVGTGLNYRILGHRAQPISIEERQRWRRVWKIVCTATTAAY